MIVVQTSAPLAQIDHLEPAVYSYPFDYPLCSELICDDDCHEANCPTVGTYNPVLDNRYFMSVFAPRMKVNDNTIENRFDFHQGSDIVDKKKPVGSEVLPPIHCMCDGEVVDIYDEADTPDLELTSRGRSVTVMCDQYFAGNNWGPIFLAFRHLSAIETGIVVGNRVSRGAVIGPMGQSGITTSNHLHLSVQRRECINDPNCDIRNDASTNLYEINVHPDRVFNPNSNPHLMNPLNAAGVEIKLLDYENETCTSDACTALRMEADQSKWALFRIAVPYNQVSMRAIRVRLNGSSFSRTYDFEQISAHTERPLTIEELPYFNTSTTAEDYDHVQDLKLFVFPFNRSEEAVDFYNNYQNQINELPVFHSGQFFPILDEGIFQREAYVLDVLAYHLPENFAKENLVVEVMDIWGNAVQGRLSDCAQPEPANCDAVVEDSNTASLHSNLEASAYHWQYRPKTFDFSPGVVTNSNAVQIQELWPGTEYEYQLQVECTETSGLSDWSALKSFTTPCITPTEETYWASFPNPDGFSARLHCSIPAVIYSWRWKDVNATGWYYVNASQPDNFVDLENLAPGMTYEFQSRLRCVAVPDNGGWSDFSAPKQFTTPCATPLLGQITSNVTAWNAVTLNCLVTNADEYYWRYRPKYYSFRDVITSSNDQIEITDLWPGTTYEYQVQVQCPETNGPTDWSPIRNFTSPCVDPTIDDVWVVLPGENDGTARLYCSIPDIIYTWQYRVKGAANWSLNIASHLPENYLDLQNLAPGTTYEFRVRLRCSGVTTNGGWSNYSPAKQFTTGCATAQWNQINSNVTAYSAATLSCQIPDAYQYHWRYRPRNYQFRKEIISETDQINLTDLWPGTRYEYQVQLQCTETSELTDWSSIRSFDTPCVDPTSDDIWVTFPNENGTSARLYCGILDSIYNWQYRVAGATNWSLNNRSDPNNYLDLSNLTPATTYEFRVRLRCSGVTTNSGWSNYSPAKEFTTPGAASLMAIPQNTIAAGMGEQPNTRNTSALFGNKLPDSSYQEEGEIQLKIFPNPTHGLFQLTFDLPEQEQVRIQILDITGRSVFQQVTGNITSYAESLDIGKFPSGLYIVKVQTSQGMFSGKVMIE